METLEARATWAANKRLELRIGPSEVDGLEVLRPEVRGQSVVGLGYFRFVSVLYPCDKLLRGNISSQDQICLLVKTLELF